MNVNKLTMKAQEAMAETQTIVTDRQQQELAPEHLLLALLNQKDGVVAAIADKLQVAAGLRDGVEQAIGKRPQVSGGTPYLSPALEKVFSSAEKEAKKLKDDFVSTEHLLLGIIDEGTSAAAVVLKTHQVTKDKVMQALVGIRGSQRITDQNPEDKYQALQKYGRDLT